MILLLVSGCGKNDTGLSESNESMNTTENKSEIEVLDNSSDEKEVIYITEESAIDLSKKLISEEEKNVVKNYDSPHIQLVEIDDSSAELLQRNDISGRMAYVITYELDSIDENDIIYVDSITGEVYGSMPVD